MKIEINIGFYFANVKKLLVLYIVALAIQCQAGRTVRIDFFPGAIADFDVFFKKGFESEGYTVYVNYFDRAADKPYDLMFKYEWNENVLKGFLYDQGGKLIRQLEKKILYYDRIESVTYQFLGELLERKLDVKDRRGRIKNTIGMVGVEMVKLDSAIYILTVRGSETMSMAFVQSEFLRIAKHLTGQFSAYFEGSYHQYETGERWLPSGQCIGWKVRGIVVGSDLAGQDYFRYPEPPPIYKNYLENLVAGLTIPDDQGYPGFSNLYILRNSSKSADYGPNIVYLDGKSVCQVNYKNYAVIPVSPGLHTITIKGHDAASSRHLPELQVKVLPLNNSYVSIIWSFHIGIIYQEVKENEAKLLIQGLTGEECN